MAQVNTPSNTMPTSRPAISRRIVWAMREAVTQKSSRCSRGSIQATPRS